MYTFLTSCYFARQIYSRILIMILDPLLRLSLMHLRWVRVRVCVHVRVHMRVRVRACARVCACVRDWMKACACFFSLIKVFPQEYQPKCHVMAFTADYAYVTESSLTDTQWAKSKRLLGRRGGVLVCSCLLENVENTTTKSHDNVPSFNTKYRYVGGQRIVQNAQIR